MSHIDSFKHEIVGLFGSLPVYHPLENIEGDFKCNHQQLMIGGGSGEHPALVLQEPLTAVAHFISEVLDEFDEKAGIKEEWETIIEPHLHYGIDTILKFYDWEIETYQSFAEQCKSKGLPNSYRGNESSLEQWLILGFGEFIYYSMPDLAAEIMSKLDKPYNRFNHIRYNNIMLIPPNFPVYANGGNAFGYLHRRNT